MFLFCDAPSCWENQHHHNPLPRSRSEWSREWLKMRREIQERRRDINMVIWRRKTSKKALNFLNIKAAHKSKAPSEVQKKEYFVARWNFLFLALYLLFLAFSSENVVIQLTSSLWRPFLSIYLPFFNRFFHHLEMLSLPPDPYSLSQEPGNLEGLKLRGEGWGVVLHFQLLLHLEDPLHLLPFLPLLSLLPLLSHFNLLLYPKETTCDNFRLKIGIGTFYLGVQSCWKIVILKKTFYTLTS